MRSARSVLGAWLGGQQGLWIEPEYLCLTASTSEAYAYLFKLLCDPGDAVLVPTPSYPLFEYLAGLEGVRVGSYPLSYDGEWHVDKTALRAAVESTDRLRAVVAVHPNNPTGNYLKTDELDLLVDLCVEHGLALISDEVFFEHALAGASDDHALAENGNRAPRAASQSRCLSFSLGGLSKLAGLPQLKLGWIAANGPPALLDEALERLAIVADSYLSVGGPVQHALRYVLHPVAINTALQLLNGRLSRNLAVLDRALTAAPVATRLRCEAGWTAVLRLPHLRSSEDWAPRLLDAGVLVQPGYFYGLEPDAYVVLSLLCDEAAFSAGASTLAAALGTGAG